jgi:hypothetical protein
MSVVAVFRVKDERDIIEATVRRMKAQVDHVIVEDNASTDGTRELLDQLGVEVLDDPTVGYFQAQAMTRLAEYARVEHGATWVILADADEVWLPRTRLPLRCALATLPAHVLVAEAALYDHVATGLDPDGPDPVARIGWRRPHAGPLPKVAVRAVEGLTIHQGNHGASFEHTDHPATVSNLLCVRHFPYRSVEQLVRKVRNGAAAYAAAGDALPADFGAHWRQWGRLLDEHGAGAVADLFRRWYWRAEPDRPVTIDGERQPALVYDPAGTAPA